MSLTAVQNVSPLACFPPARPFFHAPTTSKRLLRRLVMFDSKQHKACELDMITLGNHALRSYMT